MVRLKKQYTISLHSFISRVLWSIYFKLFQLHTVFHFICIACKQVDVALCTTWSFYEEANLDFLSMFYHFFMLNFLFSC